MQELLRRAHPPRPSRGRDDRDDGNRFLSILHGPTAAGLALPTPDARLSYDLPPPESARTVAALPETAGSVCTGRRYLITSPPSRPRVFASACGGAHVVFLRIE